MAILFLTCLICRKNRREIFEYSANEGSDESWIDAGHRVAANPCGSHDQRQEQPDEITGGLSVLLTTALHPKATEQIPAKIDRPAASYPADWP